MSDIKSIVFDEIALEGLEGITVSSLWLRLEQVDEFRLKLDQQSTKAYVWKNVVLKFAKSNLEFYRLPEQRTTITIYNRYAFISPETGYCIANEGKIPADIYTDVSPVVSEKVRGSCKDFNEREPVPLDDLAELHLDEVEQIYGNRLVIVADQKLRDHALRIDFNDPLVELTPVQYCIVERCGRCRYQGDLTFGYESGNFKDPPKTLFYFRKLLLKKGLITKQMHTVYSTKTQSITRGLLLMLPRFHIDRKSPMELAAMKVTELLRSSPNQRCEYVELKTHSQIRTKPFKHIFAEFAKYFRVFDSEETTKTGKKIRYVELVRPFGEEDADSSDEEELNDDDKRPPVAKEVAKVKLFKPDNIPVNRTLMSQSYQIVKAFSSLNGVSLREFQNELFVPRLDARMLTRMLERLNVVTTISTNIGRQKVIRYFLKDRINTNVDRFNNENNQLDLGKKATLVTLKRANIILNAVKEHQIIDQMFYFKKIILESERNLPYKVDQKSVKRILQALTKEGHVNWIKTTFGKGMSQKRYNLICVPTISEENDIVKERIEQARFKYFSVNHSNLLNIPMSIGDENESNQQSTDPNWSLLASLRNDDSDLVYQPSVSRQYGLEPKLKKIITFYKFIFFTLSDECRKENSFEENDWRKHITPLPKSYEKDTCLLGDLIPRIPLSVFVKTVFITYVIPGLDELLKDPVRRHHTLQMLPHDLIKNLFRKRKYIFCMVELLTLLAHLNLVELNSKLLSIKEQVLVRLLKSTEFVEEDYVKKYRLKNLNDVEMFVNDLELHGSRTDCKKCSFDSRLYIHNARNWSYQPKFLRNVPANELNRFARLRNLNDESMNNLNNLDMDEIAPTPFKTPAVKRKAKSKRPVKRKRMLNGISGYSEDADDQAEASTTTPRSNRKGPELTRRLRRNGYDKEDMNALSLLRKQRSEWSKEEDSFLLMCRVASILIHPTSIHFTCVSKHVLRDELNKYLPNLAFDKTSKACQRRLMYMLRNPRTRSHVLDWVAEVKQDLEMSQIKKPDVPITHTEEWTACFIDLLHRLLAKFQNKEHFASPSSQIEQFKSLDEIYSVYNLIESEIHCVPQKPILFFQPNNTVDIYVNVVLNVLSSSLLANMFDSDPDAVRLTLTLFKIYQRYPDTMIRAVVNKMKINGMIAKIRSSDRLKAKHNKDKKLSMFKISQHYCSVLKSRYSIDTLAVPLELKELAALVMREDGSSSQIAFLTNLITMDRAMFNINVPDNFVSIKDITRAFCDDSPDKSMNCDMSTTTNDEPDILANDLWSNDGSTQFEGSVSLNSAISQAKRTSRYVLCSLRQRMTLIDKYQLSQDYLVLNKCNIACRISSTENLVNLDKFVELLERQKQLVQPDRTMNESKLNSTERAIIREVTKARELGLSYRQLFEANQIRGRNKTKESVARYAVQGMLEKQILFEVGVEEVKLVTYRHIIDRKSVV